MKRQLSLCCNSLLKERYRILHVLGRGGMGTVYEAYDERKNKSVAIKESSIDFEREAKLLALIDHPLIPNVNDYFVESGCNYLVMDLIRGEDFSEKLTKRDKPFNPKQVCDWAVELLNALESLHNQDVIHRDIKPANLKLAADGKIMLLDFGIANYIGNNIERNKNSLAAATLQFAPLEQLLRANTDWFYALMINHEKQAGSFIKIGTDTRSDLYSVGVTFYEFLTKSVPPNAALRALSIWSGKPDNLIPAHELNPQIPRGISEILQKAMSLYPSQRFNSAREMSNAFRQTIASTKTNC